MNSNVQRLAALPYVRRVVSSEGVVGALTDDSVGVHDEPKGLSALASFHAPMSIVGAAECEVLWDRVAIDLSKRLNGVEGVLGLMHRWCDEGETVEVEVGRKQDNEEHRFSSRETVERPAYPEGVYAIIVQPSDEDRATAEGAYDESFLSSYVAERRKTFERARGAIVAKARKLFYSTPPLNTTQAAEQERQFKARVKAETADLIAAMEAEDTDAAKATFVQNAKRAETAEEKRAYLAGATRAACAERVSRSLEDIPGGLPWGVEIVLDGEQDERYKALP